MLFAITMLRLSNWTEANHRKAGLTIGSCINENLGRVKTLHWYCKSINQEFIIFGTFWALLQLNFPH